MLPYAAAVSDSQFIPSEREKAASLKNAAFLLSHVNNQVTLKIRRPVWTDYSFSNFPIRFAILTASFPPPHYYRQWMHETGQTSMASASITSADAPVGS
jgi:hypothetical protein